MDAFFRVEKAAAAQRGKLIIAGWVLIGVSLLSAVIAPNWGIGLVEWIGLMGAAAALAVLTLHYRPALLPPLAAGGVTLGLILSVVARV